MQPFFSLICFFYSAKGLHLNILSIRIMKNGNIFIIKSGKWKVKLG